MALQGAANIKRPQPRVPDKQSPAEAGLCHVDPDDDRQGFGAVLAGAAGSGALLGTVGLVVAGGMVCVPPWPVVVGGGLLAVVLEGSLAAKNTTPTIAAAMTTMTRMLSMPKLSEPGYRDGFRLNPGSGSLGSWNVISTSSC
jgi:hypothetical protein